MKIKKLQRLLKQSGVNRVVIDADQIRVEQEETFSDNLPVAQGYYSHTVEDQLKAFLEIKEDE